MEFTHINITFTQVLIGLNLLLFGILFGFWLIKKIGKKELNEEQLRIYNEVQNYARIAYNQLKKQFGNEEILKEQLVQVLSNEFPKIDKKIIKVVIDFIFEEANQLIEVESNQTS